MDQHVDVLIIGAGISGISAACHLEREGGGRSYAILERRERLGGTWDLFRYPGIRSDSDMYTFGFGFRAWHGTKILAAGGDIREYVQDTAAAHGVTDQIRYGRRVVRSDFDSASNLWTVRVEREDGSPDEVWTAGFVVMATGYYDYDEAYRPAFPGEEDFAGQVVHPQFWPEDLDYAGKRVVVIGSGATAITLLPAMADETAHVTMLQRSPTYILALPEDDPIATAMRALRLPASLVHRFGRARNIFLQRFSYDMCRRYPRAMRRVLLRLVRLQTGGAVDMKHFTPSYNPWDQRLCIIPRADLFRVLKKGQASIVTDHIERFTEKGIRLKSGEELPADLVITATGLKIQLGGGGVMAVDGEEVRPHERSFYKGVLLDGVPNMSFIVGYTNASWTLKADLAADYTAKLLARMKRGGYDRVTAVGTDGDRAANSILGDSMTSGYIARGNEVMPRQGTRDPWMIHNNYYVDRKALSRAPIDDAVLEFARTAAPGGKAEEKAGEAAASAA
ncbi:flavin-containing monooxygenase [Streptomyces polyrhachis]|uniref:Flavin-containing monooxygenase n=1 Tax=Streptomyces polyrhachis TaxID=1282885 RepID=A0ABW2GJS6_9ACTN